MVAHHSEVPENRSLDEAERVLVRWMLEHGVDGAAAYLPQVEALTVVSKCACGCPSINFVDDRRGDLQILADYMYDDPAGGVAGVFLFAVDERLGGLDIWSIDGYSKADTLPAINMLRSVPDS